MNATLERASFLLSAGGPVLIILLILSILALSIIIMKCFQFQRFRLNDTDFIQPALEYWRASNVNAALAELYSRTHPTALTLEIAIRGIAEKRADEQTIREEVIREANEQLEALRSHLRTLEVIASISPLLGLLGTVMGMINAFQQMEAAGTQVSPSILSGGVWEALLTTAVGLAIAIPVVVALNGFESRIEKVRHSIEDASTRIFTVRMSSFSHQKDVTAER